jgi:hypothetical protein
MAPAGRVRNVLAMAPRRLYLKTGVDPANAGRILGELLNAANRVMGVGGGPGSVERLRDEYLSWVEMVEPQLQWLATDGEVLSMFQTERYWRIRELFQGGTRPWPLIDGELEIQKTALQRMADDLGERVASATAAPGALTVLDTNSLLEFLPPDQIPWATLIGMTQIRLVVPLRVVEELDTKKYAARKDLAQRARRLLSWLEDLLGESTSAQLQADVTIEVPIDSGPRRRPTDADEEILDSCREWQQLSEVSVRLVTADTGMRLRAQALGLAVVRLPARYERVPQDASWPDPTPGAVRLLS